VSRRQAYNQSLKLALGDLIKLVSDNLVVPTLYKIRPLALDEANKIVLTTILLF